MHALACAEAQLHEKKTENECVVESALVHAMRVAHASCETALTRVEPLYDAAVYDTAECALCTTIVASALENASVVVSALEYASTQSLLSVDVCGDAAMRTTILTENIGAVALSVVLLSELDAIVPSRGLFLYALRNNTNVQILRVLLSSPVLVLHITDRDDKNNTALMVASKNGHTEAVKALLAFSAVVASASVADNILGYTALMHAADQGHAGTVTALLACPAIVEFAGAVNQHGNTALILASCRGHVQSVVALLACPAAIEFVSTVNKFGFTALMFAVQNGHAEVVAALLTCPAVFASSGVVQSHGNTALMLAAAAGNAKAITVLLTCPAIVASASVVNGDGDTALMLASRNGNSEAVTALLTCPAVVASTCTANKMGYTALMLASPYDDNYEYASMMRVLHSASTRTRNYHDTMIRERASAEHTKEA
jgi:ankyrin repeat protein